MNPEQTQSIEQIDSYINKSYKYGFVTEIEMELATKGLNEDIVKFISDKNEEPTWLLEWRLDSDKKWIKIAVFI